MMRTNTIIDSTTLWLLLMLLAKLLVTTRVTNGVSKQKQPKLCPIAVDNKYTAAASLLYSQGKVTEAIECLQQAVKKKESIKTLLNLANVLTVDGQYTTAEKVLKKAKKLNHTSASVLKSSATNFFYQKRYKECIKECRQWIKHHPGDIEAHLYTASSLYEMKEMTESLKVYNQALNMNGNHTPALVNAAVILNNLGDYDKAVELSKKAMLLNPSIPEAFLNYAAAEISMKHYASAIDALQRALDIKPDYHQARCKLINVRRLVCDWSNYEEDIAMLQQIIQNQIYNADHMIQHGLQPCHSPGHLLHFPLDVAMHKAISIMYAASQGGNLEQMKHNRRAKTSTQIHVGFVSYNFNNHPATHLLLNLFRFADRSAVKIFAYSLNSYTDKWRNQVEQAVDVFRDISQASLEAMVQLVKEDSIEVLIDLMGFSSSGRPALFELKPAPIQIHYLGYPGTTGSKAIDYYICDRVACDPSTINLQFMEKLIYLPAPYLIAPQAPGDPPQTTLTEFYQRYELPSNKFIFCCLSQLGKLDQPMFHSWLEILSRSPSSVLWLIRSPPEAESNILAETERVNSKLKGRILFTDKLAREELLTHAPQVCHLFLDTHLYNAHTVSAEMLQGGLPILTYPGATMVSQVVYSHLTSLGLEQQLVANNLTHYIQLAVKYCEDRDTLLEMRATILEAKKNKVGLFNTQQFVQKFVEGLQTAWIRYENGLQPDHLNLLENNIISGNSHVHWEL